jgi:hypothetical protein
MRAMVVSAAAEERLALRGFCQLIHFASGWNPSAARARVGAKSNSGSVSQGRLSATRQSHRMAGHFFDGMPSNQFSLRSYA